MRKRLLSVLTSFVLVITLIGVLPAVTVSAYDSSAALSYAVNHWNDGKGLCAEFVSDCLSAGGLSAPYSKLCNSLMSNLINGGYGAKYYLSTSNGAVKMSDNSGKLSPGDPVFYYCNDCNTYPHVVICGGSVDGYATAYGHNSAWNNKKLYNSFNSGEHKNHSLSLYSFHISGSAPKNAYISIDKINYDVDEPVTFHFNTDSSPNCNTLWIYCPDGNTLHYSDLGDSCTLGFGMRGYFEALVQAWNGVGEKCSERISFYIGPPQYSYIHIDKNNYAVGEKVNFTFNTAAGDAGDNNTLWIYKPDGSSTYYQNCGKSYSLSFNTPGRYEALVEAWNGVGSKISDKVSFYIGPPQYAKIQVDQDSYAVGEKVEFSFDTAASGDANTLWIYKPDGSSTYYQNCGKSYSLSFNTPGKYEALVEAWNGLGSKTSEKIEFTISEQPTAELKYQLRQNDDGTTDFRAILVADEQAVLNADSASVYATIADYGDTDSLVVKRAYRSIKAGGKTITADEGKVFLIGKFLGIPDDMIDGMTAHFTLGENTYERKIS